MFRFEKLDVWQRAVRFGLQIYTATQSFPDSERFGLTSQLRRASVSVSSNIAEGSGRMSDADFARFLEIAYGSLMEVVSQANVAKLLGLMPAPTFEEIYRESEELARMLSGLRSTLTKSSPSRQHPSGS